MKQKCKTTNRKRSDFSVQSRALWRRRLLILSLSMVSSNYSLQAFRLPQIKITKSQYKYISTTANQLNYFLTSNQDIYFISTRIHIHTHIYMVNTRISFSENTGRRDFFFLLINLPHVDLLNYCFRSTFFELL